MLRPRESIGAFRVRQYHWFRQTPARELLEMERGGLERLLSGLFGYRLLQVGLPVAFEEPIAHSRLRHQMVLDEALAGYAQLGGIRGDSERFPVASDSIDLVFLPHTLDFSPDPHQVLREAERVLIPEGRLILFGFNPWSLWGLWRLPRTKSGTMPWCGNFLSTRRVCDWLSLLGFDVEIREAMMFRPPLRQVSLMRKLEFVERLGHRWWPFLSGAYALRAVKRVSTLTPLKPTWNPRARMLPGQAVEPTARIGTDG